MRVFKDELIKLFDKKVRFNEPLSAHTTFKIGGPADYFVEIKTSKELVKLLKLVKLAGIPVFFLGGGSNILVSDKGFRGLVIKNRIDYIKILGLRGFKKSDNLEERDVILEAGSGTVINRLVRFTIDERLEGLEVFLGLPGTVGGAIAGNSHWQDKKISDYVLEVKKYNGFILGAVLKLRKVKDDKELWKRGEDVLLYRKKTQPLDFPSAGCIFKNISLSEAKKLNTPNLTRSAGYLIDQCGLKGRKIGKAEISQKHANFIINLDGAKASDVLELIRTIKTEVFKKFGVELKEEIIYVGFDTDLNK